MKGRLMKKSLFMLFLLCGCASATPTYTADGKAGYSLTCSGTARGWGMCYEKAGEICGTKGYEVVEKSGETGAVANVNASGGFASTTHSRTMLIQCKD